MTVIARDLRYPNDWPRRAAQEKGIDVALAVDFVVMVANFRCAKRVSVVTCSQKASTDQLQISRMSRACSTYAEPSASKYSPCTSMTSRATCWC